MIFGQLWGGYSGADAKRPIFPAGRFCGGNRGGAAQLGRIMVNSAKTELSFAKEVSERGSRSVARRLFAPNRPRAVPWRDNLIEHKTALFRQINKAKSGRYGRGRRRLFCGPR